MRKFPYIFHKDKISLSDKQDRRRLFPPRAAAKIVKGVSKLEISLTTKRNLNNLPLALKPIRGAKSLHKLILRQRVRFTDRFLKLLSDVLPKSVTQLHVVSENNQLSEIESEWVLEKDHAKKVTYNELSKVLLQFRKKGVTTLQLPFILRFGETSLQQGLWFAQCAKAPQSLFKQLKGDFDICFPTDVKKYSQFWTAVGSSLHELNMRVSASKDWCATFLILPKLTNLGKLTINFHRVSLIDESLMGVSLIAFSKALPRSLISLGFEGITNSMLDGFSRKGLFGLIENLPTSLRSFKAKGKLGFYRASLTLLPHFTEQTESVPQIMQALVKRVSSLNLEGLDCLDPSYSVVFSNQQENLQQLTVSYRWCDGIAPVSLIMLLLSLGQNMPKLTFLKLMTIEPSKPIRGLNINRMIDLLEKIPKTLDYFSITDCNDIKYRLAVNDEDVWRCTWQDHYQRWLDTILNLLPKKQAEYPFFPKFLKESPLDNPLLQWESPFDDPLLPRFSKESTADDSFQYSLIWKERIDQCAPQLWYFDLSRMNLHLFTIQEFLSIIPKNAKYLNISYNGFNQGKFFLAEKEDKLLSLCNASPSNIRGIFVGETDQEPVKEKLIKRCNKVLLFSNPMKSEDGAPNQVDIPNHRTRCYFL